MIPFHRPTAPMSSPEPGTRYRRVLIQMDDVGRGGVLPGEMMTKKEDRHGSTSTCHPAHEIRVTATYQRDGETTLPKSSTVQRLFKIC